MTQLPKINFPIRIKKVNFGSGTRNTPEFNGFMRTVHNDFKKLKESGIITDYKITTGHFYFFAFITANDEQKSKYYLSVSDVRHFPDNELLIRKVKDYNDYTGGINNYIKLDKEFVDNFLLYLLTNSHKKA